MNSNPKQNDIYNKYTSYVEYYVALSIVNIWK